MIDIWTFVAADNPNAADKVLDRLHAAMLQLSLFPRSGVARDDIRSGLRILTSPPYLILFRLAEQRVEIVRCIHGARDLPSVEL